MLLFTTIFTGKIIKFRAPRNTIWRVDSINFSNQLVVANEEIYVVDREFPTSTLIVSRTVDHILGLMPTDAIANHQILDIDHKTKYLTIASDVGTTKDAQISIYGEIVRASRKELLIEWFRKR